MYHDMKYFRSFIRPNHFYVSYLIFLRSFNWTDALNSHSALDLFAQRQQTFKYLWHILLETKRKVKFLWNVQCVWSRIDAERPKEKYVNRKCCKIFYDDKMRIYMYFIQYTQEHKSHYLPSFVRQFPYFNFIIQIHQFQFSIYIKHIWLIEKLLAINCPAFAFDNCVSYTFSPRFNWSAHL